MQKQHETVTHTELRTEILVNCKLILDNLGLV